MASCDLLIVGISGVTCGGKTTTACELNKILPNTKIFSQDDYFLNVDDPRHTWIPELNHINFDILSSLDMAKMHEDILDYVKDFNHIRKMKIIEYRANGICDSQDIKKYVYKRLKQNNLQVLIIEGFSIFNYKPMLDLFDLKYYFILEKEECCKRRVTRVYEPPDCPGYFEKCVWPEYQLQLKEVKKVAADVTYFDEYVSDTLEKILTDVLYFV